MALDRKTILFAWELGEGLGHLPPLKAIAGAFRREGVRVAFALREPALARAALAEIGAPIDQAPYWPTPALPATLSGTYADILAGNGLATAAGVKSLVAAWDQAIDRVKPDLLVCEHAPSAALAAFRRVPTAFVGNGFVVPPADAETFPPIEKGKDSKASQKPVLDALQQAFAEMGRPVPRTVCEPFRGVFRGVTTFPELDTYAHVRREAVLGPIEAMPPLTDLPSDAKLFAYSAADFPRAEMLVQALMEIGPKAQAYFRGAAGVRGAVLRSRGVAVFDEAPSLARALPDCSAVFSHGGTGFANAALAAGRPHIVAPRHLEAELTARRLQEMGVGINLAAFDVAGFREAVKRAWNDSAMHAAAQAAGAAAQAFLKKATPLETAMAALMAVIS